MDQTQSDLITKYVEQSSHDIVFFVKSFLKKPLSKKQEELLQATKMHKHILAIFNRQGGKSTCLSYYITYRLCFGVGIKIILAAPIQDQSKLVYDKVDELINHNPFLLSYLEKNNMEIVMMKNKNHCLFMSASPNAHIRGHTPTDLIIDESQDIVDEKYFADLLPMGAVSNPTIIECGTPREKNHFFTTVTSGGVYVIRQPWFECEFINKEYVENQRRLLPTQIFRAEYENVFSETSTSPFPSEQMMKILEEYTITHNDAEFSEWWGRNGQTVVNENASFVMGIDLGKQNDSTVITVIRSDKFPIKIIHQEEILGMNYVHIAQRIKKLCDALNPTEINVDYTGEKGVTDLLISEGVHIPLKTEKKTRGAVVFTADTKTAMITQMQALVQKRLIRLPKQEEGLFYQFLTQQYEIGAGGKYHFYHPQYSHDDKLWSTLLAVANVTLEMSPQMIVEKDIVEANIWGTNDKKPHARSVVRKEEEEGEKVTMNDFVDCEIAFAVYGINGG